MRRHFSDGGVFVGMLFLITFGANLPAIVIADTFHVDFTLIFLATSAIALEIVLWVVRWQYRSRSFDDDDMQAIDYVPDVEGIKIGKRTYRTIVCDVAALDMQAPTDKTDRISVTIKLKPRSADDGERMWRDLVNGERLLMLINICRKVRYGTDSTTELVDAIIDTGSDRIVGIGNRRLKKALVIV